MSKLTQNPLLSFFVTLGVVVLLAFFGPEERSLGSSVRIVYLHGAWVMAAEAAFIAAGFAGLAALGIRKAVYHQWSAALGRAGIVFWLTYLPLSLLAMQANWNGLFLAEPRFRLALTFAVVGLLLQIGLWLIARDWLTSLANIVFIVALRYIFATADYVMHPPPSPIFSSGLWNIIIFFIGLNLLTLTAAFFLTRWFLTIQQISESTIQ